MANNLLIVESPAKAKTIEKILGEDFAVKSCYGHIRDLEKKNTGIDIENNYEPTYIVPEDKKAVVKELKSAAKNSEVWLATDEDREGEAISWHLCEVLGLDPEETKRIVFHEITPKAIKSAVANPRRVNNDVVNAQQARRILDRLVGFELSPVLWRKVKPSLSAGRVQSVAVRIVVEREREISSFESQLSFKVVGVFEKENEKRTLKATLTKNLENIDAARDLLDSCKTASFSVADLQVKPAFKTPSAPFTTSTLQQEASRKLGFSVGKTMAVAQKLYEAGKITYMRTDSTNLSETAIDGAAKYIIENFGEEYSEPRNYTKQKEGAQEAHEAIRPTYMQNNVIKSTREQERLYELIWKRTAASQMAKAELEKTTIKIDISGRQETFTARGEVIKFPGFLKVYLESQDDEDEENGDEEDGLLPAVKVGEPLNDLQIVATEKFTRPSARYSEASLVKKLEELQIGRPSTYAPTISTIQKRGYVVKESRPGKQRNYRELTLQNSDLKEEALKEIFGSEKNKLFPTDMGMLVNDFLMKNFSKVVDYGFTADIEKEFDVIAQGEKEWRQMIDLFYKPFHEDVEDAIENAERVTGERELGYHPENGKKIIARLGRYGPMIQLGETPAEDDENAEKPKYAKLQMGMSLETVTLEDALELLKLPREVGTFEGKVIKANFGRFGPYVQHDGKFASIKEGDPLTITEDEAIVLINEKREADKNKYIASFEEEGIEILNGRWGPYIKKDKKNFKIPKDVDATTLTLEDCLGLIATAPDRKRGGKKAKAKTKAKVKAKTKKKE